MSKPSASNKFMPAAIRLIVFCSILTLAVLAVMGIAGSASLRAHRAVASAAPAAKAPVQAAALSSVQRGRVQASLGNLPLAFEANQGQTDPQVKYMARGNGYTLFLTPNDTVFAVQSSTQASTAGATSKQGVLGDKTPAAAAKVQTAAIHMHLVNGNAQPQMVAGNQLPGHSNYFIGNDRSQWHSNVEQFARVSYRDVYPGVDMAFYGVQKQLEFDFIVAPGASIAPIQFGVSGAKRIATDDSGNLVLASSAGDVLLHRPIAYQQKDGARQPVNARFVLQANNQVGFELGNYDRSRDLVIDPSVSYSTYLGGTAEDDGYAIAVDGSGNAYVTGQTKSTDFPTVAGAYKTSNQGAFDVFVTKISPDGSSLIYSTYVGGSGNDSGNAIAVDGSGNAFVAGGTGSSTNFPITTGAFQTAFGGGVVDAFVFELASSGGSLTYSTLIGGNGDDVATGLALAKDGSGDTFLVGSTGSANFPTTSGTIQTTLKGLSNGFVTKLNSAGTALVYSTFLGAGTGDLAAAVAVDSSNNAYVTGSTQNSGFPTTTGAFQTTCGTAANCNGGLYDAFVSVIKPDGSGFVYSTFLGGGNADQGLGIAVDTSGDAYVTGLTLSNTDFPTTAGVIQRTYGGGAQDAFVTALNPSGSALLYSTYLGGTSADAGAGIAVDGNKNVYVTGQTNSSTGFPTANATQGALKGGNDAFVTEINSAGTQLLFSTYLGGSMNEDSTASGSSVSPVGAIAVDSTGANIYVAGNTASTDFPATTGAAQKNSGGGAFDAFVTKYSSTSTGPDFSIAATALSPASVDPGGAATSTVTVTALNGYSGTVNLTCGVTGGGSPEPICSLNPTSGNSSTLTVATTGKTAALNRTPSFLYAMWLPVIGLSLIGMRFSAPNSRRKKLLGFLLLGLMMAALFFLPACSSSSKGSGGGCTGCTPPGSYTVTVTGTDSVNSALTHSVSPALTLTVN